MARKNGLSRAEIHSGALTAGRNLIEKQGFKNFSMRQIAKEIGYTVGVHGICALSLSGKLQLTGSNSADVLIDDLIDKYFIALVSK